MLKTLKARFLVIMAEAKDIVVPEDVIKDAYRWKCGFCNEKFEHVRRTSRVYIHIYYAFIFSGNRCSYYRHIVER